MKLVEKIDLLQYYIGSMENQELLFNLLKRGAIKNCSSIPKVVETVISRVYIFDEENLVLKFYKRDNDWWNTNMQDISGGQPRIYFIRQDFTFNNFLNSRIYRSIKKISIKGNKILLTEANNSDDELVIVMAKQDFSSVLTDVLFAQSLDLEDYKIIGREFAQVKLTIPKSFLPNLKINWYGQMRARLQDLKSWVESEDSFPKDLREKGLTRLDMLFEKQKLTFLNVIQDDLFVSIDCNPENLIFNSGKLSFVDAYPPKDEWRVGTFDLDILRTAADIYALAGKEAFNSYMNGVDEIAKGFIQPTFSDFYLLYGAMISGPYFVMLSSKNPKYIAVTQRYLVFLESLLAN